MKIELDDIDVIYTLQDDVTADGKYIVKILPRTDIDDRDEDYDISLTADMCEELARVLEFMADELRRKE